MNEEISCQERIMNMKFARASFRGRPAIFTEYRVMRGPVPDELHVYDFRLRERDSIPDVLKNYVRTDSNFGGTIITKEAIEGNTRYGIPITPDDYIIYDDDITLKEFFECD